MKTLMVTASILFSLTSFASDDLDAFFADFPRTSKVIATECFVGASRVEPLRMDFFGVMKNEKGQWVVTATALPTSVRRALDENVRYEITSTETRKQIEIDARGPTWTMILDGGVPTMSFRYPNSSPAEQCYWTGEAI